MYVIRKNIRKCEKLLTITESINFNSKSGSLLDGARILMPFHTLPPPPPNLSLSRPRIPFPQQYSY